MVGAPSKRSLQLWFMACYDLDSFCDFVAVTGFNEANDIPWGKMQKLLSTDTELMLFAFRLLRQAMFGEETIQMKADAFEKRPARKKERDAARGDSDEKSVQSPPSGRLFLSPSPTEQTALTTHDDWA